MYCPTDDMIADIMTKALAKEKHENFVKLMGLTTTTSQVEDMPITKVNVNYDKRRQGSS